MKSFQHEFLVACEAFNLSGETGADIDRILAEDRERLAREVAATEYAANNASVASGMSWSNRR